MKFATSVSLFASFCFSSVALAIDHRVEALNEAAPRDELAAEIADQLAPTGFTVIRGTKTTLCDVWLCKQLPVQAGFQATGEVNYPFAPGELIGVVRFARKSADFRDQDIASGLYTLRYGLQPVDGAHVGTSLTRDFLMLVRAADDTTVAAPDFKALTRKSATAAESNHPAVLSLQRSDEPAKAEPAIRHDEDRDWWVVDVQAQGKSDDAEQPVSLALVIVGVAGE